VLVWGSPVHAALTGLAYLEQVQQRTIKVLGAWSTYTTMRGQDRQFLQSEEEKCNLVDVFSYLMSEGRHTHRENRAGLYSEQYSKKPTSDGYELHKEKYQSNIRKKNLRDNTVKDQNRCPERL